MKYIPLFHDFIGLIHSTITTIMSLYIITGYLGLPLDSVLDDTSHFALMSGMKVSTVYFALSTILTIFFEPWHKIKSTQIVLHHIAAFVAIFTSTYTQQYLPFYGMWYIMEISSIFLCLRTIVKNLEILKDKALMFDLMFIVAYIASRFIVPIYIYYQLVTTPNFGNYCYIIIMILTTSSIGLNLMWLKEIYGMAKYKFFNGASNKNK